VPKVEVVKDDNLFSLLDQFFDDDAANVTGPAWYQDFHGVSPRANYEF